MLPVEAHTTALEPSASAFVMAIVMPRSLKEPVGLEPSTLIHTEESSSAPRRGAGTNGVDPSPRVTISSIPSIGRRSR